MAPEATEEIIEVSSDIVYPKPLGRLVRMIVRNSVSCVHCGEVLACTIQPLDSWVEHLCDDAQFGIRGGCERTERMGSNNDYSESCVYQNVVALGSVHNTLGKTFFPPEAA